MMFNKTGPLWVKGRFFFSLLLLFAGVVYAIFPIDLIPDILGPVGWIDDMGVLVATFANSAIAYFRMKKSERK